MKDARFDARIVAARPKNHKLRTLFTDRVMSSVQSSEILSAQFRRMSVNKKETPFMKLRHLPKLAILAIAVGALLIVSSGVYAAYHLLWQTPQVEVSAPTTSPTGRKEVAISFSQCGNSTMAQRYELKRSATITPDQIDDVVKAQCELQAIGSWAQATFPNDNRDRMMPHGTEPYDSEHVEISMATHLKVRDASAMTFAGLTKYNQVDKTLPLTGSVRYFADGVEVTASDITEADPVVYITSYKEHMTPQPGCDAMHCSISGTPTGEDLLAVVKLSMPFEFYDQFAWQSLTERTTCAGNDTETCLTGYIGGIGLYESDKIPANGQTAKEIQGVITTISDTSVALRASSGALFTFETPSNLIASYNANRAAQYNNQKAEVGDSLRITYLESQVEHSKQLTSKSLMSIYLQTEMVGKSDAPSSY